jgi:hypothetical protein
MILFGNLNLNYENNGINFNISVELNKENYLQANNLFNVLSDYVNTEDKSMGTPPEQTVGYIPKMQFSSADVNIDIPETI